MIYFLKLFILILILMTHHVSAIIQPNQGQISVGVSRTSTDRQTHNYTIQVETHNYDPGMGFYLSYGLSDTLNIYAKTQPFQYKNDNSGEEASFSYTRIGLQYLWTDSPWIALVQQVEAFNYAEKRVPPSTETNTDEVSNTDSFVASRFLLYLNIFDVIKPYGGAEYFFRGPPDYDLQGANTSDNYIKDRSRMLAGASFEFTKNIQLFSEYNFTNETVYVLFQYNI